jgi:agmatinase
LKGFGDLPGDYASSGGSIVIIPVGYDQTSTWIKGSEKGPEAIIEASANMELYDIETDSEVYRKGIFTEALIKNDLSTADMCKAVEEKTGEYMDKGKFVVVLGGEHSVSIGAFRAAGERFDDLTVLQLDAHSDMRDEYEGSRYNHACVMARARECADVVQVGIRSMDISERGAVESGRIFFAHDIAGPGDKWYGHAIDKMSSNVWVTVDLDVFDSSVMGSTGTPEPGGLDWYTVVGFLKAVSKARNVVGFDVVELCPRDCDKGCDFLAAKLVYKFLSYKFGAQNG